MKREALQALVDSYGRFGLRWNAEGTDIEYPPRSLPEGHKTAAEIIAYAESLTLTKSWQTSASA